MKLMNFIMFEISYRMSKHYNRKFKKWTGIFDKYYERLDKA